MYTRDDLNCTRGYEFWLMKEARKRNPDVVLYGLAWGGPYWLNNQTGYYGPDTIDYHIKWLQCARDYHGLAVDRMGLWNEKPWGNVDYVKQLRAALDAAQFTNVDLILLDGGTPSTGDPLWRALSGDADFNHAVTALGIHYPCSADHFSVPPDTIRFTYGKKVWASEDWWSHAEFGGAACWAKLFNQNFLRMVGVVWGEKMRWRGRAEDLDCAMTLRPTHAPPSHRT
jgi:galactosylceramidase